MSLLLSNHLSVAWYGYFLILHTVHRITLSPQRTCMQEVMHVVTETYIWTNFLWLGYSPFARRFKIDLHLRPFTPRRCLLPNNSPIHSDYVPIRSTCKTVACVLPGHKASETTQSQKAATNTFHLHSLNEFRTLICYLCLRWRRWWLVIRKSSSRCQALLSCTVPVDLIWNNGCRFSQIRTAIYEKETASSNEF